MNVPRDEGYILYALGYMCRVRPTYTTGPTWVICVGLPSQTNITPETATSC
ncbi:hypothetical protein NAI54_09975 [Francisella tularensis subsp. holarctica]|nr:hypothetical protein [Francisella tularensis subsp. holarctica]